MLGTSAMVPIRNLLKPTLKRWKKEWHRKYGTQVWAWGSGSSGQLGNGFTNFNAGFPVHIESLDEERIQSIACGHYHSLARSEEGNLFSWGWAAFQGSKKLKVSNPAIPTQLEGHRDVIFVCAGRRHTCIVDKDHSLWTWGIGENGQLGHGNYENEEYPKRIESLEGKPIKVDSGWGHNVLLMEDGSVYSWGHGDDGALGHGDFKSYLTPKKIKALENVNIVDISVGADFSLFLDSEGTVFSCGLLELKCLDNNSIPLPIKFPNGVSISKITSGFAHALAISKDNILYSCGWNADGQLGIGTSDPIDEPVQVSAIQEKVLHIAAGRVHSVCSTESGTLLTWGNASNGRLGNGQISNTYIPSPLYDPEYEGRIISLACGQDHSLALIYKE